MPISPQERKYLRNKHRGGKNNSKGNTYENIYATYSIASLINEHIQQLDSVYLTSQLENQFVDDLLIVKPNNHRIYHQVKDVKDLTWKTNRLQYDFKRQMDISSEANEDFELKLVHSNDTAKVTPVPDNIKSCTSTLFFPAERSLNRLILSCPYFKGAIQNITVSGQATDDELLGIARAILGTWDSMEQKNVSLQQISEAVHSISEGYVNIKTYPNIDISDICKGVFNRCGLMFYTRGTTLYWSAGNGRLTGKLEWTPEVERKLEKEAPPHLLGLINLLS